jgi:hypothetical protein
VRGATREWRADGRILRAVPSSVRFYWDALYFYEESDSMPSSTLMPDIMTGITSWPHSNWGVPSGTSVTADTNHDGRVDGQNRALILSAWGPCPDIGSGSGLSDALANSESHEFRTGFNTQLLHHSLLVAIDGLRTSRQFPGYLHPRLTAPDVPQHFNLTRSEAINRTDRRR